MASKIVTYDDDGDGSMDGLPDILKPMKQMIVYMKNDGSKADSEEDADWSYTHEFSRNGDVIKSYRTQLRAPSDE